MTAQPDHVDQIQTAIAEVLGEDLERRIQNARGTAASRGVGMPVLDEKLSVEADGITLEVTVKVIVQPKSQD